MVDEIADKASAVAQRPLLTFILLVAVAAVVAAPIFGTGLLCDDFQYWLRYHISELSFADMTAIQGGRNRPLTTTLLVRLLGGLGETPAVLGALRLVHHCLNALLVGALLRRAWCTTAATSLLGAVAFLVWSSHAEVYWQSSLHDVLAATFVLLGLVLMSSPFSTRKAVALAAVSLLAYVSKESAWCLPGLSIVAALATQRSQKRLWGIAVVTAVLLPYLALRVEVLQGLWGDVVPDTVSTGVSVGTLVSSVSNLLLRSVIPGWAKVGELKPVVRLLLPTVVVLLAVAAAYLLFTPRCRSVLVRLIRNPFVLAGAAYLASLAPVAQLSVSLNNTENLRYLYLPTVFVAMVVALAWQHLRSRAPRAIGGAVAVLLLLQAGSLHAIGWNWVNASKEMTIYRRALQDLVDSAPEGQRFILACAPDNYRGAFSARNASSNLVASLPPYRSRTAVVLATEYVRRNSEPIGCDYGIEDGELVLTARSGRFALTHPRFFGRENPVSEHYWTIAATKLRSFRAQQLRVRFANIDAGDVVAVYRQHSFAKVDELAAVPLEIEDLGAP